MTSPAQFAQEIYQLPSDAFSEPALVNSGEEPGQVDLESMLGDEGLPRHGTPLLMAALSELNDAMPGYIEAEKMYKGEIGDLPVNDRVARLMAKAKVNEIEDLNYAAVPVDTISSKLGIRAVVVIPHGVNPGSQDLTDEQKARAEDAQLVLDDIRKDNKLDIEEVELLDRVCRYGDAYLEVWPSDVEHGPIEGGPDQVGLELPEVEVLDGEGQPIKVSVFVVSPLNVRLFYDAEQPLLKTHAIKSWSMVDLEDPESKPRHRATLYVGTDRIERWICDQDGDPGRKEDWKPYLEEGQEWPLSYPDGVDQLPFFHFSTGRPYGTPEHRPAYGSQRLINKIVSAHGTTIDFEVFPQRYALLDPKSDQAMLNLVDPDNPEDDDDDPEGSGFSQLQSDPSAVWKLYANTVGQFEPADPQVFMGPFDRYIKSIAELCGIPLDRFTGYATPPSGESRRLGNEVLYEKVGRRRRRYEAVLSDAYEFGLKLAGVTGIDVVIKWEPLNVAAGPEDWTVVGHKQDRGVPVEVSLVEAGYSEDEVRKWTLSQDGADLVRRVALLNQIGTAVQTLAAGVGVGLVSREQAGDLVARVMGLAAEDLPALENPVSLQPPPMMPPPGAGPPSDKDDEDGPAGGGPTAPPMPAMPPPIQVGVDAPGAKPRE